MPNPLPKGATKVTDRFRAIDWLRGLSVLFMIECHALFLLRPNLEHTPLWNWLQHWNGMVSVCFLFAAGFAAGLVGSKGMSGDATGRLKRSRKTLRRISGVWAVSLWFRLTAFPVFEQPAWFLKFDILSCICFGLLAVWAVVNGSGGRRGVMVAGMVALLGLVWVATPWAGGYRGGEVLTGLLNASNGSMFAPFPWLGYLLIGAVLGVAASNKVWGRTLLAAGLVLIVIVGYAMGETEVAKEWWRSLGHRDVVYPLYNVFERLWKLGLIGLVLCGVEAAWAVLGRVLTPVAAVLEYFSRNALGAYFAHLSLLYGFLGIQFTRVWHRQSDWGEYAWRVALLIGGTVIVCYLIKQVKVGIAAAAEAIRAVAEADDAIVGFEAA